MHYDAIIPVRGEQKGQTGQTKQTLKLDFPGNLFWAAIVILTMFLVCTGVKMHIFNQKNNLCTSDVQNTEFFCKQKKNSLTDNVDLLMKSCPTKARLQNAI